MGADERLVILSATRAQIELYVRALEGRGLAATTIDRRLSTVCGFYRFTHIDGRIASNPAQYVRRPKLHPTEARGLDHSELVSFLFAAERIDHAHAALAALLGLNGLRVSEACSADIENLGFEHGHRTLRIIGKGNKPAVIPLVPRMARTIDRAIGERTAGPTLLRHDGSRLDPAYRPPVGYQGEDRPVEVGEVPSEDVGDAAGMIDWIHLALAAAPGDGRTPV